MSNQIAATALTPQEQERFVMALVDPSAPNETLTKAMKLHSENVQMLARKTQPDDNIFTVRMSDNLSKQLTRIESNTGLNRSEIFSRAIALYEMTKTANLNNEEVIIKSETYEKLIHEL